MLRVGRQDQAAEKLDLVQSITGRAKEITPCLPRGSAAGYFRALADRGDIFAAGDGSGAGGEAVFGARLEVVGAGASGAAMGVEELNHAGELDEAEAAIVIGVG